MKIIIEFWWEGVKYALTSICAIYVGYLMQTEEWLTFDLLVLTIPALTASFFFLCYTLRFQSKKSRILDSEDLDSQFRKTAIFVLAIVTILLIVIIGQTAKISSNKLILAFTIQAIMYCYYSYFLLRRFPQNSDHSVRHQLFWSVIMSIGISLYYGFSFSKLSVSIIPLAPVFLIGVFFVIDQYTNYNKRIFAPITLIVFFVSATLAVLYKTGFMGMPIELGESFYVMTLCLTISAYLAVFEAWKVTSDIVINNSFVKEKELIGKRYFIATLYTLILSIWIFPGLFILSPYGAIFFYGFTVHAIISLLFWYRYGLGKYIKSFKWDYIKSIAGLLFLALLVLAKLVDEPPNLHIYQGLISIGAIFGFGGLTGWMVAKLINDYREARKILANRRTIRLNFLLGRIDFRTVNINFFLERINAIRILCILSFLSYVLLNLVLQRFNDSSSLQYYKMEMALIFYGLCIVTCGSLEFLHIRRPKRKVLMTNISSSLIGFLILSRVITSLLVALAVFLPSIYAGVSLRESGLSALPFFLSAIGGFALNDYYDAKKDLINKPYRAIPSGKLTPNTVISYGTIMLTLAAICAFFYSHTYFELTLYFICILGVALYNLFVKYLSLSKTFLTAIISSLPLFFSVIVYGYPQNYLFLPVATCCFILGREWLMDIRDIKGDSNDHIVTIAMKLGPNKTAKFGFCLQIIATLLLLPIVIYNQSYWSISLLFMIALSVIILVPLWSYNSGTLQRRVIQLLWLPMLFGLMLFLDK